MIWLIQLLLPLALLLWLAFRPARHLAVWILQIGATAAVLLALHLAGLWIMLPWWTSWIYWGLFATALWRGRGFTLRAHLGPLDYLLLIFFSGLIGLGGYVVYQAIMARTPPTGEIAVLSMPLPSGHYYVASGGSREVMNAHLETLGRKTARQRNYWGQSYGVDLVATDRWGLVAGRVTPRKPHDYHIFGTHVQAPCSGQVVHVHDGAPDHGPADMTGTTSLAGNHALIRCGLFDILLAHFRRGSLRVAAGDLVREGQTIGAVGNSGATDMPHLHIHAQRPGTAAAPFSGKPVPMRIEGRYLMRGDRP